MLSVALETLHRFMDVWFCMGLTEKLSAAALNAQHQWRARGIQIRALLAFLKELDDVGLLSTVDQEHLISDTISLKQVDIEYLTISCVPNSLEGFSSHPRSLPHGPIRASRDPPACSRPEPRRAISPRERALVQVPHLS